MPGQKKARVSFIPDRGVVDYTQLFAATSMMPSHVIADQLNIDVTAALLTNKVPLVEQIAQAVEHHLGPQARSRPQALPVVGAVQDRIRAGRRRAWCWSPTTGGGAPRRSPSGSPCGRRAADIQDRVNNRSVDVVDVAAGSSGALATPDNYERADSPSAGIEQLIFAPQGPLAQTRARRAFALCTPRDAIAHDAGVPIANSRLSPAPEDAVAAGRRCHRGQSSSTRRIPTAARDALGVRR